LFLKKTGEANKFDDVNRFVWNAYERGQEIHMQGAPSQVELLYQQFKVRGDALKKQQKEDLLDKYGGVEHLDVPKEYLGTASDLYLEYSADGKIIRGAEAVIPKSKWEEDVLINNHKSIWGSYWEDGKWGYACCKQTVKNSYCTGQAGIAAKENLIKEEIESEEVQEKETKENESNTKNLTIPSMKLTPKDPFATPETPVLDENKVKKEIEKLKKREKNEEKNERKRQYNSITGSNTEVTPEEMEAYRKTKLLREDPMLQFKHQ